MTLPPTGTIWSFATYDRAFHPGFADLVPYVVGLVEVTPGVIMVGNIVGEIPPTVGAAVGAVFEPVADGVALVQWQVTG